jgi:uncharacterized surface protein with fasciclin (FAS1) repeats
MDTLIEARSFCTLLGAVRAAGLEDVLRGPGPYTLFAPDDLAFAALPRATVADIMRPENRLQLVSMIRGYLIPLQLRSHDLAGKRRWVATIGGHLLMIDGTRGTLMIDDDVEVLAADITADNGIMHIIDTVLLEN